MNRKIRELFWKVWWNTPWCIINRNKVQKSIRRNFDYEKNSNISIIATNCIGGELYSVLGLRFNSPFINCSMNRNDLVKLAVDFSAYMKGELRDFTCNERGELTCFLCANGLEPIKIAWPHDSSVEYVVDKFKERVKRINYEKLVFITDDNGLFDESYELFDKVSAYKKIILSSNKCNKEYDFIEKLNVESVRGLQYKNLKGYFVFCEIWNFVEWFNK